ncbi:MAG TPA: hypothetical protein VNV42_05085 [Solirubrobacteraceae bacterium]|jgi:hypothetical protein|nr:hypothetical protein [Solirubrobacteraceae bacterium]
MRYAGGRDPIPGYAGGTARGESQQAQVLARVVFAVLVVACFVAFVLTQRLKHTPTPVQNFEADKLFHPTTTPAAACRGKVPHSLVNSSEQVEYLSFKPAQAERVTVEIIDSGEKSVATIVRGLPAERYKQLSLCWNGQLGATQRGGLAPSGEYRIQVKLLDAKRTVKSTKTFKLEAPR